MQNGMRGEMLDKYHKTCARTREEYHISPQTRSMEFQTKRGNSVFLMKIKLIKKVEVLN